MLQANLKFISLDKELQIVVTSSVPKEGKSTVSAIYPRMAQLGHRSLFVDADLHCPSQHHIWNLTNATGLLSLLIRLNLI